MGLGFCCIFALLSMFVVYVLKGTTIAESL